MESIKSSRVLSFPIEGDFRRTFRLKLSPTPDLLLLSPVRLFDPFSPRPLPIMSDEVGLLTSSLKLSRIKALTGVRASLNLTSSKREGDKLILRCDSRGLREAKL